MWKGVELNRRHGHGIVAGLNTYRYKGGGGAGGGRGEVWDLVAAMGMASWLASMLTDTSEGEG